MSNFIYYEKLEDYEEQVKKAKLCDEKDKEIEQLHSIIKEAREKLLCYGETFDSKIHQEMEKELLEILNK